MALALDAARRAAASGEVPVGAVLLARDGRTVLATASNATRLAVDPTAHAEILALRAALVDRTLADPEGPRWPRLEGTTLYTTVEPCFMCAGALVHARIARVVWGVRDPKFGGAASLGRVLSHPGLNHRSRLTEGVGARESAELLRTFFRNRR
ncbi:MAG: nucleoside deaminase [Planctomycetota bacterium]